MNKKGFTIIELVVVITIIMLLILFTVPNMINELDKSTQDLLEYQAQEVYEAAETYLESECKNHANDNSKCILNISYEDDLPYYYGIINVSDLVDTGYLDNVIFDGEQCSGQIYYDYSYENYFFDSKMKYHRTYEGSIGLELKCGDYTTSVGEILYNNNNNNMNCNFYDYYGISE